jgi:hypothetical protein
MRLSCFSAWFWLCVYVFFIWFWLCVYVFFIWFWLCVYVFFSLVLVLVVCVCVFLCVPVCMHVSCLIGVHQTMPGNVFVVEKYKPNAQLL